jgi:hypothetical protein
VNKELLRVEGLKKYFPVTKGLILQKAAETGEHTTRLEGIIRM